MDSGVLNCFKGAGGPHLTPALIPEFKPPRRLPGQELLVLSLHEPVQTLACLCEVFHELVDHLPG